MNAALIVIAACGLLACGQEKEEERVVPSGERFTMRVGESTAVEGTGLAVRFEDVLRDSRCPPDVQCIRAGEAVVVLVLATADEAGTRLELEVPPGGGAETMHEGHRVQVVSLEPAASASKRLEREDYALELEVE